MTQRQPKGQPRKRYPLQLSDDERSRYQARADAESRDLADWIRSTLDAACTAPPRRKK